MLSDFAGKLWDWLKSLFSGLGNAISSGLGWLGRKITDLFSWLGGLLWQLLQSLLDGIAAILKAIFKPIFDIIAAFFYFIGKLIYLLALLVQLIIQIVHVLLSFAWGLIKTLAGLSYSGGTVALPGGVAEPFSHMQPVLSMLQLDKLAYVLLFAVWLFTAYAVIKITGNFAGGGNAD
jgi:hypothetical protein